VEQIVLFSYRSILLRKKGHIQENRLFVPPLLHTTECLRLRKLGDGCLVLLLREADEEGGRETAMDNTNTKTKRVTVQRRWTTTSVSIRKPQKASAIATTTGSDGVLGHDVRMVATAVNLKKKQQHKTLPGPLRSLRPVPTRTTATHSMNHHHYHHLLIHCKSNPHVGWFRHAPPAVLPHRTAHATANRTRTVRKLHELRERLHHHHDPNNANHQSCLLMQYQRRGHLRGGGRYDDDDACFNDATEDAFLFGSGNNKTASTTTTVLTRLASWLLDVPLTEHQALTANGSSKPFLEVQESQRVSIAFDDQETISSDQTLENAEVLEEEEFGHQGGRSILESSAILSTQAEAYYAFESTSQHGGRQRTRSHSLGEEQRLDYDITQMDIVRMNRVASRHLDVQSIVQLPVITYNDTRSKNKKKTKKAAATTGSVARMKLQQVRECRDPKEATMSEETQRSEFSWMFIPDADESFCDDKDKSSADEEDCPSKGTGQNQQQNPAEEVCVICLERFCAGDRLRVLPCRHSFHVGCIDRWLSGSHSFDDCYTSGCPTCKRHPHDDLRHRSGDDDDNGSVPSWAFAQIGGALARESRHF
jgi:Ring finger domain